MWKRCRNLFALFFLGKPVVASSAHWGACAAGPCADTAVRGRGWLPQLLPQPEAKSRKGRREPELSVTRPVAQLSDKSRVNSSSYRNEALASHGGSQVLNVAPQTERNPGHSELMAPSLVTSLKSRSSVEAHAAASAGRIRGPGCTAWAGAHDWGAAQEHAGPVQVQV